MKCQLYKAKGCRWRLSGWSDNNTLIHSREESKSSNNSNKCSLKWSRKLFKPHPLKPCALQTTLTMETTVWHQPQSITSNLLTWPCKRRWQGLGTTRMRQVPLSLRCPYPTHLRTLPLFRPIVILTRTSPISMRWLTMTPQLKSQESTFPRPHSPYQTCLLQSRTKMRAS